MDLISALDLLIGYLSKDDLFVGRIIEVKKIKYIPNGKELGERAIFSTYKTSTERVRTALLYKMDDGYFDLKTKQTYQAIKKTRKYSSNEINQIPTLREFYIEEESLIPAYCYGLIDKNTNHISKKKILKKFDKLAN